MHTRFYFLLLAKDMFICSPELGNLNPESASEKEKNYKAFFLLLNCICFCPSLCGVRCALTIIHFKLLKNYKANCYHFLCEHLYETRNQNCEIHGLWVRG